MSSYAVALINIDDRAEYAKYEAGFMEILNKYQEKVLAVDEKPTILEGAWDHTRTVILEFVDTTALQAWYQSSEYQNLMQYRRNASSGDVAIIQGL